MRLDALENLLVDVLCCTIIKASPKQLCLLPAVILKKQRVRFSVWVSSLNPHCLDYKPQCQTKPESEVERCKYSPAKIFSFCIINYSSSKYALRYERWASDHRFMRDERRHKHVFRGLEWPMNSLTSSLPDSCSSLCLLLCTDLLSARVENKLSLQEICAESFYTGMNE